MKNIQIPDYLTGVVTSTKESFCDMLTNENLWSDTMVKQTLNRVGSQAFNIDDVRHIIQNYLTVLSETIREGRSLGT